MRVSAFFFGLAVLAFILFAVFGDDDGAGVPTRA